MEKEKIEEALKEIYFSKRDDIISRLNDFKLIWKKGSEEDIFKELVFCILTPQTKAKSCWIAVENLSNKNLLVKGNKNKITEGLKSVRFRYKKAEYIVEARRLFLVNGRIFIKSKLNQFNDVSTARDWLVGNVKGIGYKEASHFLRNIGLGENLAILDRHILKNLKFLSVIKKIPYSLSRNRYSNIEKKMRRFSEKVNIPMSHLDLVMWYKETKEVFK